MINKDIKLRLNTSSILEYFGLQSRISIQQFICINLILFILPVTLCAKELTISHHGLLLNADLTVPENVQTFDTAILIVHGGLAHRDMENLTYLRSLLNENDLPTLAINLSLGLDKRYGMYDCSVPHRHTNDDAIDEISIWVDWLESQGVKNIILLGHSRGGAQAALFAVERDRQSIKKLILLAPATKDNGARSYETQYQQALQPSLQKAIHLVNNGKGDTLLSHSNIMFCRDTKVSAQTFVSYYGEELRLDTPYLLGKVKKPTLVIVAEKDNVVVALDKKLSAMPLKPLIHVSVVQGAGHMFRDLNMDDATEFMFSFLESPTAVSKQ